MNACNPGIRRIASAIQTCRFFSGTGREDFIPDPLLLTAAIGDNMRL